MRLIIAVIMMGLLLMYHLLRGKKGLMEMSEALEGLTSTTSGKVFIIAGIMSGIFLTLMLITGRITLEEIIELDKKMMEFCPFCM